MFEFYNLKEQISKKAPLNFIEACSALNCPHCGELIVKASVTNKKINYQGQKWLAEDGDGIQPTVSPTEDGIQHLDGELLYGRCEFCKNIYWFFDMWLSSDNTFLLYRDDPYSYNLPEEFGLIEKATEQTVYDVQIDNKQIGMLERFDNMEWGGSKGTIYIFISRLFQAYKVEIREIKQLCTDSFIILKKALDLKLLEEKKNC